MTSRRSEYSINPLFLTRWSPRAFDGVPLTEKDVLTLIEAARWAPSAYNIQPWRFLYSLRHDPHWDDFLSLLDPFNAGWANQAGALIFLLSERVQKDKDTGERLSKTHAFDSGAAWAQLALQATQSGFQAHAMAGVDFDAARRVLQVPDHFDIQIAIAVGTQASPHLLPEQLQERESPSDRFALSSIAMAGTYQHG